MLKLLVIIVLILVIYLLLNNSKEGLTNISHGEYPISEELPLLTPGYAYTGKKHLSDVTYPDIWKDYPTFPVGSYAQRTNNLKYWKSPDNGLCVRANFCNTFYKDKKVPSNITEVLGPAAIPSNEQVRVNYYVSE